MSEPARIIMLHGKREVRVYPVADLELEALEASAEGAWALWGVTGAVVGLAISQWSIIALLPPALIAGVMAMLATLRMRRLFRQIRESAQPQDQQEES